MSRFILPVLTCSWLLVVSFAIRADDELDRFRAKEQVASQKLTSDVRNAIDRSRMVEKSDPIEAKYLLLDVQRQVKDSSALSAEQRARLVSQLQSRIRDVEEAIRSRKIAQEQRPFEKPKGGRPASNPTYTPPSGGSGASGLAKDVISSAKRPLDEVQSIIKKRETNFGTIIAGIERTPVYPTDDRPITFPKGWKPRKPAGPELTAKEVALLKALNSVLTVNYDPEKFKNVIEDLQTRSGITLIIDENSLKDVMLDYDDPVNFKLPFKVTVRTALKKVLGDKGLTYIIKEGVVHVMTPKKASEVMVIRSYPVEDLIAPDMQTQMFGPFVARAQMLQNAQQLIMLIQTNIEPTTWQPAGPASITFYEPTRSLIIRASAEMHYQMGAPGLFGR